MAIVDGNHEDSGLLATCVDSAILATCVANKLKCL